MLVGYSTCDDAAVFRIDAERALVQTLDFFTPVVDDPFAYGAIAAANSVSDVYAMGGVPLTAMAIACFPEKGVDLDVLVQMMCGGVEKLREAGVALVGGHTVADSEIKFGYSITGLVHPERIVRNAGARAGDALVLTKPLGIGILTSGIKLGKTPPVAAERAIQTMSSLNRAAAEVMVRHNCEGATDVTGNGLLGHAFEMAEASDVCVRIHAAKVPILPSAYELAEAGLAPRTIKTTWTMIEGKTKISSSVAQTLKNLLLDPQTSGGLLISVNPAGLASLMDDLARARVEAAIVGTVEAYRGVRIQVD
jgi:selenide,water dikinase